VRRDLEARLREMDGELQKLKRSVGEQTGDAQKQAQKQLEELQSRKDELAKELEGVGREGGKAMEDLQKGVESALKDLERELNKLGTSR
jgi:archaellum component FlaC